MPLIEKFSLIKQICVFVCVFVLIGCEKSAQFELIDGQPVRLEDYRGRWLLINFWADWCRPCLEEIPHLNQLYQQRQQLGLELIAFSFDRVDNNSLLKTRERWQIQYPMAATDPVPQVPFSLPSKLPATVFISPEGEIIGPVYGKQDLESVVALMNKYAQSKD